MLSGVKRLKYKCKFNIAYEVVIEKINEIKKKKW